MRDKTKFSTFASYFQRITVQGLLLLVHLLKAYVSLWFSRSYPQSLSNHHRGLHYNHVMERSSVTSCAFRVEKDRFS